MNEKVFPLKISRDLMAKVSYMAEKRGITRRKLILKAIEDYIYNDQELLVDKVERELRGEDIDELN